MKSPSLEDTLSLISNIQQFGINPTTRELYLHGHPSYTDVEEEPGVEHKMATSFIKNLHFLDRTEGNILVHQETCGGYWQDGIAIYDAVVSCQSTVTFILYAQSRSMSSIIPQAADLRILMPHTDMMLHYGSYSTYNHWSAAMSEMRFGQHSCDAMLEIYAERCQYGPYFQKKVSMTKDKVKKFLHDNMTKSGDWWLTAEEAVDYGLADGILGDDQFPTIDHCR